MPRGKMALPLARWDAFEDLEGVIVVAFWTSLPLASYVPLFWPEAYHWGAVGVNATGRKRKSTPRLTGRPRSPSVCHHAEDAVDPAGKGSRVRSRGQVTCSPSNVRND